MDFFKTYFSIFIGSVFYALSTVLFIFPASVLLGGTSGISVILEGLLHYSPGEILMAINFLLIILAFIILGKQMAIKTMVGSVLTTIFIGAFEKVFVFEKPLITNTYISAIIGAVFIAVSSGIMFFVDSSSGGTDIIALVIKKFSNIKIGRALLITDILIVIIGGFLSNTEILLSSLLGLIIKTTGIDLFISLIKKQKGSDRG